MADVRAYVIGRFERADISRDVLDAALARFGLAPYCPQPEPSTVDASPRRARTVGALIVAMVSLVLGLFLKPEERPSRD
jgi:hypothetical protein